MKTEIPRAEWTTTLDAFSAAHDGWLISVDVSPAATAGREITDLPLAGITFEPAGSGTIIIAAGRSGRDHIDHTISAPVRVSVERTDMGAEAALYVASADGTETVLRLRTPVLPETVDGLPEWS